MTTSIAAGHRFDRVDLAECRIKRGASIDLADTADVRYVIGEASTPYTLQVTVDGEVERKSWLHTWHGQPTLPVVQSIAHLAGALYLGQACVATRVGALVRESLVHGTKPAAGDNLLYVRGDIIAQCDIPIEESIAEPILYLGPAPRQFGHFLADFVSRLWAMRWAIRNGVRPAIAEGPHRLALKFQHRLARGAKLPSDYRVLDRPVRLERAFFPSPLYDLHHGIHPDLIAHCATIRDRIASPVSPIVSERVYFSRRLWPKNRILLNEAAVEATFERYGFAIVHPQTLSIGDQLAVVRGARHLAGPVGSQMFLALFREHPETTIVLVPNAFALQDDAVIGCQRGTDVYFVMGEMSRDDAAANREQSYSIDLALLDARLHALFGAPG